MAPSFRQQLGECFYLVTDMQQCEEAIASAIRHAHQVQKATDAMIAGSVTPEELLEIVEPFIPDMDQYMDEVQENLLDLSIRSGCLLVD